MPRPLRSEIARSIANLAIEVGDPGRMAKARRIHRKGGVSAVEIDPRTASTSVSEDDSQYSVELSLDDTARAGEVPAAEVLVTSCDCDDKGDAACRHVLAGLLGLAEACEVNARLLDRWTDVPRDVAVQERPAQLAGDFFGEPGRRRAIPTLPSRPSSGFPPLLVDETDAGPVFEDAIATIRRTLTPYQARR